MESSARRDGRWRFLTPSGAMLTICMISGVCGRWGRDVREKGGSACGWMKDLDVCESYAAPALERAGTGTPSVGRKWANGLEQHPPRILCAHATRPVRPPLYLCPSDVCFWKIVLCHERGRRKLLHTNSVRTSPRNQFLQIHMLKLGVVLVNRLHVIFSTINMNRKNS